MKLDNFKVIITGMGKVKKDFLEEMIAEATAEDPTFPGLLEAASKRRELIRKMAEERQKQHISQRKLAQTLAVSQPAIAKLEKQTDARLSTVQNYAAALGKRLHIELRDPS